jgi:hypothetical protein
MRTRTIRFYENDRDLLAHLEAQQRLTQNAEMLRLMRLGLERSVQQPAQSLDAEAIARAVVSHLASAGMLASTQPEQLARAEDEATTAALNSKMPWD